LAYRRVRGAILRLVRRRAASITLGTAMAAPAAWLEFGSSFDRWWVEGISLILGATGVALIWIGVTGVMPDWIDRT
jgi:hypothetical protein